MDKYMIIVNDASFFIMYQDDTWLSRIFNLDIFKKWRYVVKDYVDLGIKPLEFYNLKECFDFLARYK